ncbi:hypothetical protein MEC_00303 [Bartonella alsatica IBS 382]|uniref:Uncharacterized protein n=1 Tax=Bartonella alsatica IBS 382 TaxID=1094551 RepID=J0YMA6_9HYPH|nr:hypothetical protein MEC_00303 [Bartonella alsatica IBS 382]
MKEVVLNDFGGGRGSLLTRFISTLAVKKELTSDEKSLKCVYIYTLLV